MTEKVITHDVIYDAIQPVSDAAISYLESKGISDGYESIRKFQDQLDATDSLLRHDADKALKPIFKNEPIHSQSGYVIDCWYCSVCGCGIGDLSPIRNYAGKRRLLSRLRNKNRLVRKV